MADISLLYRKGKKVSTMVLTDESINDLSVDYIVESLTKDIYEKNSIKKILTNLTCDIDVINYRADVFEDILNYPQLRDGLVELLKKLEDLRELEKFNKDGDASSLWQLINRLREIDGYVLCITMLKDILNTIPIKSQGLLDLKRLLRTFIIMVALTFLKRILTKQWQRHKT